MPRCYGRAHAHRKRETRLHERMLRLVPAVLMGSVEGEKQVCELRGEDAGDLRRMVRKLRAGRWRRRTPAKVPGWIEGT